MSPLILDRRRYVCTWFLVMPKGDNDDTGCQTKMNGLPTDFDEVIEAPERYHERVEQGKQ
jgi:hypothetical protein